MGDVNLASVLFQLGRRLPDAAAVTGDGLTLTYAALCERSARIAGALRGGLRLQPGERVLIVADNGPEYFELLFGCWAAGLAAVPVNAKLHVREVAHIARDSGARLAFTSAALAAGLGGLTHELPELAEIVVIAGAQHAALLRADALGPHPVAPDDLAWLFYTSGTTGHPKGAMLTHRNLLFASHCYYADIERVAPGDTMLHAAPLSHGSGLYGVAHLFGGGHQLVLPRFETGPVLDAIAGRRRRVSLFAAPTMVSRLVQAAGDTAAPGNDRWPGLRTIVFGGGPMYVSDLEKALACFGPRLWHLYGQGESPMTITGLPSEALGSAHAAQRAALLASCGWARTGVEVRVVDGDDRELPHGTPGEVVTRSDCVMRGYWRNPEATAAALRNGWLHTGDIGSMDARGLLALQDRSKDLIIRGGSNIYPREIEEVLLRHPAVLECAVVGRPHADLGEEPVAFVVCRPGATVAPPELERLLGDWIARFKQPRAWQFVDALPKNHYGKVLKTELRARLRAT
jgi:acyl-CoA synthetase (AMP-forming)/AMP-acid ligase II